MLIYFFRLKFYTRSIKVSCFFTKSALVSYFGLMKKTREISLIAVVLLLFAASCKTATKTKSTKVTQVSALENDLRDIWVLEWASDFTVDETSFPLGFPVLEPNPKDSNIIGTTGCNQLNGNFKADMQNQFVVGALSTTKMYCQHVEEQAYLGLLNRVTAYKRENLKLTLLEGTTPLLRYKKAD